ncbi:MAG: prepilin-type N-terminal cleavage/methylation domain-containing protein, partial [Candidatus Liptonbacteria bacterium]|nr:prepilin-type N-terminal cleavage/methylation domain-containing protein [Candidatus Liptonbacteria bacterium]
VRQGQSLIEVLVAVVVGVIVILAAIAVIIPALRTNKELRRIQVANALGKELLENVRVFAEQDWFNNIGQLETLAQNPAAAYYIDPSGASFVSASGEELRNIDGTDYVRYFTLSDACRDANGGPRDLGDSSCVSPEADPALKKITIVTSWQGGNPFSVSQYLTRFRNKSFLQDDWSGGPGETGPLTTPTNRFDTSSGIDFASQPGSIVLE